MSLLVSPAISAQQAEVQRALVQRDQQSVEFAARAEGADSARLEQLHGQQRLDTLVRPLHPDPQVARELRPYQRQQMADERSLTLPPPVVRQRPPPESEPRQLPFPGSSRALVDPIPAQGPGN